MVEFYGVSLALAKGVQMSNFAILRMQKLKSFVAVRRSMKHAFREQETPNADPERLSENTHFFAKNVAEGMQNFKKKLPEKIRKNGVLAVEFLITASPDAVNFRNCEDFDAYFEDALKYLQDKHGAENVVYAGIHRDETTPHMYAYVVPLDERGKLNCHKFYGAKDALSELQTDFYEKVGRRHGLDRGIKGSKAKHQNIKTYYSKLNAELEESIIPDSTFRPPLPDETALDYGRMIFRRAVHQMDIKYRSLKIKFNDSQSRQQQTILQHQEIRNWIEEYAEIINPISSLSVDSKRKIKAKLVALATDESQKLSQEELEKTKIMLKQMREATQKQKQLDEERKTNLEIQNLIDDKYTKPQQVALLEMLTDKHKPEITLEYLAMTNNQRLIQLLKLEYEATQKTINRSENKVEPEPIQSDDYDSPSPF